MQTRDQRYAKNAYDQVIQITKMPVEEKQREKFSKSYGSMAHKLPILIHVSGLAQALAFVDARYKGKGAERLLEDLSQTVIGEPANVLLERSRGDDQPDNLHKYMYLTEQVLAALLWYKRYAQSILDVESSDNDDDGTEGSTKA